MAEKKKEGSTLPVARKNWVSRGRSFKIVSIAVKKKEGSMHIHRRKENAQNSDPKRTEGLFKGQGCKRRKPSLGRRQILTFLLAITEAMTSNQSDTEKSGST